MDFARLEDAGYLVEVVGAHLLIKGVPFLNGAGEVKHGRIISLFDPNAPGGEAPASHQIWFDGGMPHATNASAIDRWDITASAGMITPELRFDYQFSMKLVDEGTRQKREYRSELEKLNTYYRVISGPAFATDKEAAENLPADVETKAAPEESPFLYPDTASARAGVVMINHKLSGLKIGIVGVGGTGSYVLDLIAKAPVSEIRIFDGDRFDSHNAFRAPGAASVEAVTADQMKVDYFSAEYGKMRKGIRAVREYVTAANVDQLDDLDFAFLCMDTGPDKRVIVEHLEKQKIEFIDTGMSVSIIDGEIGGLLRVTTSSRYLGDVIGRDRLSFRPQEKDNPYNQNVQIADLNALNASLAVLKWKKLCDVYVDARFEHHASFVIESAGLSSMDRHEAH